MESSTLVLTEDGSLELRSVTVPEPAADELILDIELSGVCGSDVHMWQHEMDLDYPVVPGHEFVGLIEKLGTAGITDSARQPLSNGDAVTVVPGISCGECWYCENVPTRPLTCNDRDVHGFRSLDEPPSLHGGMSEYFMLQDRAWFYRFPETLPTALGALVEPLSVATHAVERALPPGLPHVREGLGLGQSVVVQGAGPIGLLTAAAATAVGAGQVIAVDLRTDRLAMAEAFGATDLVDLTEYEGDEFIHAIQELTPGGVGPDVVIEAVGRPAAFGQALRIPRNGGTVVEVGHYFSSGTVDVDPSDLIHRQLDIYGSLAYPPNQFATAISMLERTVDRFPYEDLLNYQVGLDRATEAFEAQANGESYRATIHP